MKTQKAIYQVKGNGQILGNVTISFEGMTVFYGPDDIDKFENQIKNVVFGAEEVNFLKFINEDTRI